MFMQVCLVDFLCLIHTRPDGFPQSVVVGTKEGGWVPSQGHPPSLYI